MIFLLFKWVHILAAVVALGTNLTYSVWLMRVRNTPSALLFTLQTIKTLDDRLANPAYVLSLLTGIGMVSVSGWSFTTPWILLSLILYSAVVVLGLFGYSPILKKQITAAEQHGAASVQYTAVARQGLLIGITLGILVVAIIYLMVIKPPLWS